MAQKDYTRPRGNPQWLARLRAACGLQSRMADRAGSQRFFAGGSIESVFDYAPQTPALPVGPEARGFYWVFGSPQDVLTDSVDANGYVWAETNSGTGTALAVQDVQGGGAVFTNGTGDNNYYFYQSGGEMAQLVPLYDLAFRIVFQASDATQSDLFVGLCARLASGNLFDNRVNSVGFRKDDGDTNIDLETSAASTTTSSTAQGTLADATDIALGFHYRGDQERVYFFVNESYVNSISTNLPSTEMCVSFGLRNGEAAAKSMTVKSIALLMDAPR